jgi:hypothetical protein
MFKFFHQKLESGSTEKPKSEPGPGGVDEYGYEKLDGNLIIFLNPGTGVHL